MNDVLKTRIFLKGLLIAVLSSFASAALAGGGGGGGGGIGGNSTSVICNDPFSFDINSGYVGDDPTTAAGSCGQCCFAGSDFDGDGQQDGSRIFRPQFLRPQKVSPSQKNKKNQTQQKDEAVQ